MQRHRRAAWTRRRCARATEPFFTTKGAGKGTGLGLSMVHGLAEQSGGRFTLRSHVGQGTTAELWLPVARGTASADERRSEPPAEMQRPAALVVLAVDDDALVLTNTVAMLEDLGHDGRAASSGRRSAATSCVATTPSTSSSPIR